MNNKKNIPLLPPTYHLVSQHDRPTSRTQPVSTPLIHAITRITIKLPTPEGFSGVRISWPGWQTHSGHLTHKVSHVNPAQIKESPAAKDRRPNQWATPLWFCATQIHDLYRQITPPRAPARLATNNTCERTTRVAYQHSALGPVTARSTLVYTLHGHKTLTNSWGI